MDQPSLIARAVEQVSLGKSSEERKKEQVVRLHGSLDRFCAYLSEQHSIECIEDTTLDALRQFEFDLLANDDHHLRLVFSHLGRTDLLEYLAMVSADKYSRNKKLTVVLKWSAFHPLFTKPTDYRTSSFTGSVTAEARRGKCHVRWHGIQVPGCARIDVAL